ncbi:MAG: GTPase Era [Candidatus Hepatoplasma vulgare]|nr:MAG: GTPase Era [Candidatus Hepatoplasma sp.]
MKKVKFGYVAIVGETNVGKSTLLNAILKEKISIATRRKNTTRNMIQGIYNDKDSQIVFIDTPGFIKNTKNIYDKKIEKEISNSISEIDILLFLTPFWKEINDNDLKRINNLKNVKKYLLITQIDRSKNKHEIFTYASKFQKEKTFDKIIPISSRKNLNVTNLIEELKKDLPLDSPHFEIDNKTNYEKEFFIKEIIREKLLLNLNYEIPHQLLIQITNIKENEKKIELEAKIILNRDSHKGIIIGKNGEMIDKIKEFVIYDLEKKYNKKIIIKFIIKVEKDWKNKANIIGENY